MWEIAKICGKWLKYLTNGLNVFQMTQISGKWPKYVRKWFKYLTNGLSLWEMTEFLKYRLDMW